MGELSSEPEAARVPDAILIVEDEILIRLGLEDDLSQAGYTVLQGADADEALQVLQSSVVVDMLITDIRMPGGMDGIQLARYARAVRPQLRIMFISGNVRDLPADVMVDAIVEKPYVPADVIALIQQLLKGRKQC